MTRWWAAAVLAGAIVAVTSAQQPTFSTRRDIVRIDALVTDRGRPVRGLGIADFEVLDSGVPQQLELVSFEEVPLNIVLVLDGSGSISAARLTQLRAAGRAVLEGLQPGDQTALVTFTDAVTLRQGLTADPAAVSSALDRFAPSPRSFAGTALVDATYTAMTLLDNDPGRGLLLAFTDGVDTSSWLAADRVVDFARRANVVVYGVSAGRRSGETFLRRIAESTGGSALEITSTASLQETFARILDEFRQRYLLSYTPAGVPAAGWHPVSVRVRNRRVDVRTRPGYTR